MLNADNDSRIAGTSLRRRNVVSPIRPLAFLSVVVPIFVLLVYLFTAWRSVTPVRSSALASLGPANKSTVFNVKWDGAYEESRTAYAFTFVEGRWDDDQRVTGIRVAIESLKHTGSKRQIIVMVGANVRQSTVDVFRSHGATVIDMPSPAVDGARPAHSSSAAPSPLSAPAPYPLGMTAPEVINSAATTLGVCKQDFAPLHMYALHDRFDRVVWLDADHVVQLNMDELFLCGRFCMVYMNLQWYAAALLVIKPDAAMHRSLLEAAADATSPIARAAAAATDDAECQRAWEDFLLTHFWSMEAAPAFVPSAGQQDVPRMRLASGYALNPLFWIEKYDWSLARVKEFASMPSSSVFDVPAHSLSWPRFKPWYWLPGIYFNVHWVWAYWKAILVPESSAPFLISYSCLVLALVFLAQRPLDALFALLHGSLDVPEATSAGAAGAAGVAGSAPGALWLRAVLAIVRAGASAGWNVVGYPLGYALTLAAGFAAYAMMPANVLYYEAWPMYICLLVAVHLLFFRIAALLLLPPLVGPTALRAPEAPAAPVATALDPRSSAPAAVLALCALLEPPGGLPPGVLSWAVREVTSPLRLLLPTVLMQLTFIFLHGDYFIMFVLKIFILISALFLWGHWLASAYPALVRLLVFSQPAALEKWKGGHT